MELVPQKQAAAKGRLDGFVLLRASGAEFPGDAVRVSLSDRGLHDVVEDDLAFFKGLDFADFGENRLQLEQLANLSGLSELRVQFNGMQSITSLPERAFPTLAVLDLSFNELDAGGVAALAQLPRLRELDLTGNGLTEVPQRMCDFGKLEILLLGQNRLCKPECLVRLSEVPRLRELDASDNGFRRVSPEVDFPRLEWLSLVGNRICDQDDVAALLNAPELSQVLLYGNPISRRRQREQAMAAAAPSAEVINVVTDTPAVTRGRSKSKSKSTRGGGTGNYTHFQIAKIQEVEMRKPGEWKALGNDMIFSDKARAGGAKRRVEEKVDDDDRDDGFNHGFDEALEDDNDDDDDDEDSDEEEVEENNAAERSVFMTEPSLLPGPSSDSGVDAGSGVSIRRDLAYIGSGSRKREEESELAITSTAHLQSELARFSSSTIASTSAASCFAESSICSTGTGTGTGKGQKQMRNALGALRHALQHPLTSHVDVNVNSEEAANMARLERATASSMGKLRAPFPPRRAQAKAKVVAKRTSSSRDEDQGQGAELLTSIEAVLDRLDFNG